MHADAGIMQTHTCLLLAETHILIAKILASLHGIVRKPVNNSLLRKSCHLLRQGVTPCRLAAVELAQHRERALQACEHCKHVCAFQYL